MKLRNRLFIGLGAVAVAFVVIGFLIANTQRRYLTEQVDRQLQSAVPLAINQFGPRPQPLPQFFGVMPVHHRRILNMGHQHHQCFNQCIIYTQSCRHCAPESGQPHRGASIATIGHA